MLRAVLVQANAYVQEYAALRERFIGATILKSVDSLDGVLIASSDVVDAVVVHAAVENRAEMIQLAASYGKHVLVDGPIGIDDAEIAESVQACRQASVTLQVAWRYRDHPYLQTSHQALAAGCLGQLGLVCIHGWKTSQGALPRPYDLVTKELDAACWLFGNWPETIYATAISGVGSSIQIHLGFPDGGMAIVMCNDRANDPAAAYSSLTQIGSIGASYADDHRNVNLVMNDSATATEVPTGSSDHLWIALNRLAQNVAAKHCDDGSESVRAIAMARAVYASIKQKAALRREGSRYVF